MIHFDNGDDVVIKRLYQILLSGIGCLLVLLLIGASWHEYEMRIKDCSKMQHWAMKDLPARCINL